MIGNGYWATGITVHWCDRHGSNWGVSTSFYDDGFADDKPEVGRIATEGTLRTRYFIDDVPGKSGLEAALDVLMADAARLGVQFRSAAGRPDLYTDAEDTSTLPAFVQDEIAKQAERIGWQTLAKRTEETR